MTDAIVASIMRIRNGMTTDEDAEAIIEREIAALQPRSSPATVEAIVLRAMKNKRDPDTYGTSYATVMNEDIAQKAARDIADIYAALQPSSAGSESAKREKVYAILYEQLDLSTEVIIELAECGNLGDVTDAILSLDAAQPPAQSKAEWFCEWLQGYLTPITGQDELDAFDANTIRNTLNETMGPPAISSTEGK